jgi:crossover junction endodeoxyribonuclease RuvC
LRVLGIDTSLRSTGVAVVDSAGSRLAPVEFGVLRNPPQRRLSECLRVLADGVEEIVARAHPEAAAVEGVFFSRNAGTAVILGEARGAVIAACARRGVPVYEYAPRRVKQAVAGYGAATKEQVRKTLMSLLGLREAPQEDAGDALAVAVCHLHSHTVHRVLAAEPI